MSLIRKRGYSKRPPRVPRSEFEALRKSLKMTQVKFGEALGVDKQIIHNYENGVSSPTPNSWLRMRDRAAKQNIELSESIYQDLMRMKSERLLKGMEIKVQRMKERVLQLQMIGLDDGKEHEARNSSK